MTKQTSKFGDWNLAIRKLTDQKIDLTIEMLEAGIPEMQHIITKEESDKINEWLLEEGVDDGMHHIDRDYTGLTVVQANKLIDSNDGMFEMENLQHLICFLFKYYEGVY